MWHQCYPFKYSYLHCKKKMKTAFGTCRGSPASWFFVNGYLTKIVITKVPSTNQQKRVETKLLPAHLYSLIQTMMRIITVETPAIRALLELLHRERRWSWQLCWPQRDLETPRTLNHVLPQKLITTMFSVFRFCLWASSQQASLISKHFYHFENYTIAACPPTDIESRRE